jgi:pimeloyl-ACP methyl ester carboxylesterase
VLSGNTSAQKAIVFLHGWPDDITLFDNMVRELKSEHLCIQLSYPNYDESIKIKWGMDFPDIVINIKHTLDSIQQINEKELVFIVHDWGCFFTFLFDIEYPNTINEIILLDISPKFDLKFSIISYQLCLAFAFLLGGGIGSWITNYWIRYFKHETKKPIDSSINYNYYYLWKRIFSRKQLVKENYVPSCPVVYMFGNKPIYFHNQKWFDLLAKLPNSEFHKFPNGHWFFLKHLRPVMDIILRRLKSKF